MSTDFVLNLPPMRVAFTCFSASDSWDDQTFCASGAVVFTGTGEITAITFLQNAASPDAHDGIVFLFFSSNPAITIDAAVSALTAAIMATCIGVVVIDDVADLDTFSPTGAAAHAIHRQGVSIQITNGAAVWCVGFNNTGGALATGASESIGAIIHYNRKS